MLNTVQMVSETVTTFAKHVTDTSDEEGLALLTLLFNHKAQGEREGGQGGRWVGLLAHERAVLHPTAQVHSGPALGADSESPRAMLAMQRGTMTT